MSPSEIAFLAVGLILGAAIGAAIAEAIRARPAPRRQVRVTISPNTVSPRRSVTLADAAAEAGNAVMPDLADEGAAVAPGDGSGRDPDVATPEPADPGRPARTPVPSVPVSIPARAVAVPVTGGAGVAVGPGGARSGDPAAPVAPAAPTFMGAPRDGLDSGMSGTGATNATLERTPAGARPASVGVLEPLEASVRPVARPLPSSLDVGASPASLGVRLRASRPDARPVLAAGSLAVPVARPRAELGDASADAGAAVPQAQIDPIAADLCDGPRRLVDERCALATAARDNAKAAAEALRDAHRRYDTLRDHVDRAEKVADPREIAISKDELHAAFRAANDAARTAEEAEAAARGWLDAINDVNRRARDAARFIDGAAVELRNALPRIERLALDADAARISAETAEAACHDARERLAACEEAQARGATPVPVPAAEAHPFDALWPGESEHTRTQPLTDPEPAELEGGLPIVIRVLQGDRGARDRLVAALAGSDPEPSRSWGLRLSALFDAIGARAIEDGYLDLPPDDAFWGLFSFAERREIVTALSALGFRYDGMRAFADGRVPSARDLSLAVGYAGLDRMRIRTFPAQDGAAALYERATVAADEWLADHADDLSLGQMVEALGPRAGDFADIWNAWGRVRPALLAGD